MHKGAPNTLLNFSLLLVLLLCWSPPCLALMECIIHATSRIMVPIPTCSYTEICSDLLLLAPAESN